MCSVFPPTLKQSNTGEAVAVAWSHSRQADAVASVAQAVTGKGGCVRKQRVNILPQNVSVAARIIRDDSSS